MDNRKIKFTTRNIIGIIVFVLGVLIIASSIGSLDYMDECGKTVANAELMNVIIGVLSGFMFCGIAFPIGGSIYYADDKTQEDTSEEDCENGN